MLIEETKQSHAIPRCRLPAESAADLVTRCISCIPWIFHPCSRPERVRIEASRVLAIDNGPIQGPIIEYFLIPFLGMWLTLDEKGPLHRQTYRALRKTILAGELAPGQRLPSTRGLAEDIGVSRTTVLQAYEQLIAEGYATAHSGSGTRVVDTLS